MTQETSLTWSGQGTTIELIMRYIYLLRAGTNNYKIGIARNVKKRIESLQTSNSNLIDLITARLVKNPEQAERKLHKDLVDYKLNGGKEWFELNDEQAIDTAIKINKLEQADVAEFILDQLRKDIKNSVFNYEKMQNEMIKNQRLRNNLLNDATLSEPKPKSNDFSKDVELAIDIIKNTGKASTSMLQRKMGIGYSKAARIIDELERLEIVSELNEKNTRELLI